MYARNVCKGRARAAGDFRDRENEGEGGREGIG